ncbi:hypothetical protein [Microvirga zambiensis]|uniref:hypothetical protein n=1 Tax=Microvirga zambiensis TaxID=1402137 RepID=UPI00191F90E5|nr:hypothetical protein [Microvirga zambiensis]
MFFPKSLGMVAACAFAVAPLGTGAVAQNNTTHRSADAVAGKVHRLGVYGNVQKDCTAGSLPTIRVVTPPKNGELNVRSGKLKAGRIARCPSLQPTAQGVFYKAHAGYKGTEEVSYEVKTASGKVELHNVRITVAAASPAESKPDQDGEF